MDEPQAVPKSNRLWSQADVERWVRELGEESNEAEWQEPYKEGWRQALTAIIIKMDDDRKRTAREVRVIFDRGI